MRVLMVIGQFYPIVGGAERQAQKLAKALMRRGVEVTVLTARRPRGAVAWELVDGIGVRRHFARGIPLGHRERLQTFGYMMGLGYAMWKLRDSYDIIHVHQLMQGAFVAAYVGAATGRPVIAKVGNTGQRFDLTVFERGHGFLGPWMSRRMVPRITRVVALCSQSVAELRERGFGDHQVVRIPNGVELPAAEVPRERIDLRRELGLRDEDAAIAFVGTLTPKKGVSSLQEAWVSTFHAASAA